MKVKTIVKVMNFHSLLRVNSARRKVEQAHLYEQELKKIISSIINNRIFKEEKLSIKMPQNKKDLNIYIGSDLGFCANYNSDIISFLREDDKDNDKIIIGKKINLDVKNVILYMDKESFLQDSNDIYDLVLEGVIKRKYSAINIIYIHYYNLNKQEVIKRSILPVELGEGEPVKEEDDYAVEGNLEFIIWGLISTYVSTEIKIAEAWSWASENVKRQAFTSESLNKIDERETIKQNKERKAKKQKELNALVEITNKKVIRNKKEGNL